MGKTVSTMFIIMSIAAGPLLGDGVTLIPITETGSAQVSSDAQKALLLWEDGRETLHLKSTYTGPATDFAWVIPVPAYPKVELSTWTLFDEAERVTRPQLKLITGYKVGGLKGFGIGCSAAQSLQTEEQAPPTAVRHFESLDIRELRVDIVAAAESGGFLRWLHRHDYAVDQKAEPVLQKYIDAKFYFVVAKMGKSKTWVERKGMTKTVSGGLTPLAISFAAQEPFYPLAISAISAAEENELLLLTVTAGCLRPVEYESPSLTQQDVEEAVVPALQKTGSKWLTEPVDFSPAVRAAQERVTGPAVVVECAAWRAWRRDYSSKLVPPRSVYAGERVIITRFHAFLRPQEMRDITFRPSERKLFRGTFYIDLTRDRHGVPLRASAGIIGLGLLLTAGSSFLPCHRNLLRKWALLLLVAGLALI
jgi:hypothetical protein